MLRVDGAYLYELGTRLRPITSLKDDEDTTRLKISHVVMPAISAVRQFVDESVFTPHLRTVRKSANNLLDRLVKAQIDFSDLETFDEVINGWEISLIKSEFRVFEAVLLAELQNSPLYLVFTKGGFDVVCLTEAGLALFPENFKSTGARIHR